MLIGSSVSSPRRDFTLKVLVAGMPQPLYRRPGDGTLFVVGLPGRPYALRIKHDLTGRAEVLTSVDGRDTLTNQPADLRLSRGVVVDFCQKYDCLGWRIDDTEVGDFVFAEPARSVAVQATGSAANAGVIGVAVYREREQY